jgi:transcriptional regulator of acetoin/glycerol metabolism
LAPGDALELSDGDVRAEPGPGNARAAARTPVVVGPAIDESERRAELERLLREHRGNVTRVAHAMGKAREQVHRWIKRARFDLNHFRS